MFIFLLLKTFVLTMGKLNVSMDMFYRIFNTNTYLYVHIKFRGTLLE